MPILNDTCNCSSYRHMATLLHFIIVCISHSVGPHGFFQPKVLHLSHNYEKYWSLLFPVLYYLTFTFYNYIICILILMLLMFISINIFLLQNNFMTRSPIYSVAIIPISPNYFLMISYLNFSPVLFCFLMQI